MPRILDQVQEFFLQVAAADAEASENHERARKIAAEQALLAARMRPLGGNPWKDDYQIVEDQAWLGEPGAFR